MATIKFFLWCGLVAILCTPGLWMTACILSGCHVREIEIWKNKWIKINYKSWKFWVLYVLSICMFVFGMYIVREGPL